MEGSRKAAREGSSGLRWNRGWSLANTKKNTISVHCVSITLLVPFEWKRKLMKMRLVKAVRPRNTIRDAPPGPQSRARSRPGPEEVLASGA
jgi:hypothetical protein